MNNNFSKFDVANYLDNEEIIAAYLTEVLEENNPQAFIKAVGDVARARSMTLIAKETGLSRENLYRQFSPTGNPSYFTVTKVLKALGLSETLVPLHHS